MSEQPSKKPKTTTSDQAEMTSSTCQRYEHQDKKNQKTIASNQTKHHQLFFVYTKLNSKRMAQFPLDETKTPRYEKVDAVAQKNKAPFMMKLVLQLSSLWRMLLSINTTLLLRVR